MKIEDRDHFSTFFKPSNSLRIDVDLVDTKKIECILSRYFFLFFFILVSPFSSILLSLFLFLFLFYLQFRTLVDLLQLYIMADDACFVVTNN